MHNPQEIIETLLDCGFKMEDNDFGRNLNFGRKGRMYSFKVRNTPYTIRCFTGIVGTEYKGHKITSQPCIQLVSKDPSLKSFSAPFNPTTLHQDLRTAWVKAKESYATHNS